MTDKGERVRMVTQVTVQEKVAELERRIVALEATLAGQPANSLKSFDRSFVEMWKEFWRNV